MATKAAEVSLDCGKQPVCGCIGFCRGERFGTGVRTGEQYVEGVRDDGRYVVHNGEVVSDVTSHDAFPARYIRSRRSSITPLIPPTKI